MVFPYPLCDQTVTVYRLEGDHVTRRVARNCFYRWEDTLTQTEAGIRFARKFLLIQPGQETIRPGDRIFSGEGPEVTQEQWPDFLPEQVAGLSIAAYATPWYWDGRLCHTEAGWK